MCGNIIFELMKIIFPPKSIKQKKNIPIWKLVEITHRANGPWDITVNESGLRSVIDKTLIAQEAQLN